MRKCMGMLGFKFKEATTEDLPQWEARDPRVDNRAASELSAVFCCDLRWPKPKGRSSVPLTTDSSLAPRAVVVESLREATQLPCPGFTMLLCGRSKEKQPAQPASQSPLRRRWGRQRRTPGRLLGQGWPVGRHVMGMSECNSWAGS